MQIQNDPVLRILKIDVRIKIVLNSIYNYMTISKADLLTLCLQVLSNDNLCKQFGPRSGPTKCWP